VAVTVRFLLQALEQQPDVTLELVGHDLEPLAWSLYQTPRKLLAAAARQVQIFVRDAVIARTASRRTMRAFQ